MTASRKRSRDERAGSPEAEPTAIILVARQETGGLARHTALQTRQEQLTSSHLV
jgi:hypothetical protein